MRNVEDGGHLLFSSVLSLITRATKLVQMSAVFNLWEYEGCELGVSCLLNVLFLLTCWI